MAVQCLKCTKMIPAGLFCSDCENKILRNRIDELEKEVEQLEKQLDDCQITEDIYIKPFG